MNNLKQLYVGYLMHLHQSKKVDIKIKYLKMLNNSLSYCYVNTLYNLFAHLLAHSFLYYYLVSLQYTVLHTFFFLHIFPV